MSNKNWPTAKILTGNDAPSYDVEDFGLVWDYLKPNGKWSKNKALA